MADSQPKLIGLVWGLAATRRSVYIRQMNRANSHSGFGHDDSAISIVVVINVITIITDMIGVVQMDGWCCYCYHYSCEHARPYSIDF